LAEGKDSVVLVHGLWLHAMAMRLVHRRLEQCGYTVHSYSYPSMRLDLDQNAERLRRYCETLPGGKLHFVGHSMGGLVAARAAALVPPACRGRIVLIGTPFRDSFAARALQRLPGGTRMLGASIGQWLGRDHAAWLETSELGVIAGSRPFGLGRVIAPGLPRPNDGVVAVEETTVPGMRDRIVLHVGHSEMLLSRAVVQQVCAFLQHGQFDRTQPLARSLN
jgi:pimeloyl-ACP methyl ester carboxylesterase